MVKNLRFQIFIYCVNIVSFLFLFTKIFILGIFISLPAIVKGLCPFNDSPLVTRKYGTSPARWEPTIFFRIRSRLVFLYCLLKLSLAHFCSHISASQTNTWWLAKQLNLAFEQVSSTSPAYSRNYRNSVIFQRYISTSVAYSAPLLHAP